MRPNGKGHSEIEGWLLKQGPLSPAAAAALGIESGNASGAIANHNGEGTTFNCCPGWC